MYVTPLFPAPSPVGYHSSTVEHEEPKTHQAPASMRVERRQPIPFIILGSYRPITYTSETETDYKSRKTKKAGRISLYIRLKARYRTDDVDCNMECQKPTRKRERTISREENDKEEPQKPEEKGIGNVLEKKGVPLE